MMNAVPTVYPAKKFNSTADAEALRTAMKGLGTDEKVITNILTKRSREQRQIIAMQYKTNFGRDLTEDLISELSGNYRKTILALMTKSLTKYYAEELNWAMEGLGTNERALIDILCTLSNDEIFCLKAEYNNVYNKSLDDDIRKDTSGNFKRVLISLCCGNRNESSTADVNKAREYAQKLYAAGEQRLGTDESVFNAVLVQENYAQLRKIFKEYSNLTGHDFEDAIKAEFSGDIKNAHLSIVKFAKSSTRYFAERLYQSMKGLGTDDNSLIRIIVSRCEFDLGDIKHEFQRRYKQTLEEWIIDDTSGDYQRCLLALVDPLYVAIK